MVNLIFRNNPLGREKNTEMQLRYHESLGETEYIHVAFVTRETAREIIRAGQARWLFGDPDEPEVE